jgi:alpha-N-arabinofuranosidase
LRDALVAGCNLNIFNNHAERVKMANIAQAINVLQSMILTDKEKMIVTPTYYVFEMFTPHQDATLLPSELKCEDYSFGGKKIPGVSVSASVDPSGAMHVTLCNLNPTRAANINCELQGAARKNVSGRVLTSADMTTHNTFEQPDNLKPEPFNDVQLAGNGFTTTLPPKSVVALELK